MFTPSISIIVPCYNQAQYLDECLQSVLDQTYQDWECIIVDDGSPDNTEEIAKNWTQKDSRFIYFKKENGGVSSARNFGIEKAKGEWILPLDGDDKIEKDYLNFASQKFYLNPHIIYCQANYFGEKSGLMPLEVFNPENLILENQIFCTSFFKKESWKELNGYDEKMQNGYEDWEFWIRFCDHYQNISVIKLDYTGFQYRIKENSRNTEAMSKSDENVRNYIIRKHAELYFNSFPVFYKHYSNSKRLQKENFELQKIVNSKRYKLTDKIFSIFKI